MTSWRALGRKLLAGAIVALLAATSPAPAANIDQTGTVDPSTSVALSVGDVLWGRAVSSYTGTVPQLQINVFQAFTGNVKLALYSDSGGQPFALIATSNTLSNLSAGLATFTMPAPPAVVAGTSYWIAAAASGGLTFVCATLSAHVYEASSYGAAFPATASSLTSTTANLWGSVTDFGRPREPDRRSNQRDHNGMGRKFYILHPDHGPGVGLAGFPANVLELHGDRQLQAGALL